MLPKFKKMEKLPIFDQNHGLTPLQKIPNFRLFKLLVFIVCKRRFFFLQYRETHFPGLFCLESKDENLTIFGQNHGLTSMEKL